MSQCRGCKRFRTGLLVCTVVRWILETVRQWYCKCGFSKERSRKFCFFHLNWQRVNFAQLILQRGYFVVGWGCYSQNDICQISTKADCHYRAGNRHNRSVKAMYGRDVLRVGM